MEVGLTQGGPRKLLHAEEESDGGVKCTVYRRMIDMLVRAAGQVSIVQTKLTIHLNEFLQNPADSRYGTRIESLQIR